MTDRELENKLKSQNVEVPSSINPQNIEALLGSMSQEERKKRSESSDIPAVKSENGKKKIWYAVIPALAAACLILAFGIGLKMRNKHIDDNPIVTTGGYEEPEGVDALSTGIDDAISEPGENYNKAYKNLESYRNLGYDRYKRSLRWEALRDFAMSLSSKDDQENVVLPDNSAYITNSVLSDYNSEGDNVKTDGKYLYEFVGHVLYISSINKGKLENIYSGELLPDDEMFQNIIVNGERLCVVSCKNDCQSTVVQIYDISDKSHPELIQAFTQDGTYVDMRFVDNVLYIVSDKSIEFEKLNKDTYESYIPSIDGHLLGEAELFVRDSVCIPEYVLISAIDVERGELINKKGVMGGGDCIYVNSSSVYLIDELYDMYEDHVTDESEVLRVSLNDGLVGVAAETTISGYINNSYSIDEYNGYVRILSECKDSLSNEISNTLYVFDMDLIEVGLLNDFANGEHIQDVRFLKGQVYYATSENKNIMNIINLSKPEMPAMQGQFEISEREEGLFLFPFEEDLLLAIVEKTKDRLKISMYDISDSKNIQELDHIVYNASSYAGMFSDKKTFFYDEKNGRLGFYEIRKGYHICSFDRDNGFVECLEENENINSNMKAYGVGNYLYLVNPGVDIYSYEYKNGEYILCEQLPH